MGKNLGKHIIVGNTTKRSRKLDSVCAREGRFGSSGVVAAAVVARGGASVGARCTNMRRIGGGTPLFVWMWGVHAIPHRALQVVGRTLRMSQWRRIPLIFLQDPIFNSRRVVARLTSHFSPRERPRGDGLPSEPPPGGRRRRSIGLLHRGGAPAVRAELRARGVRQPRHARGAHRRGPGDGA